MDEIRSSLGQSNNEFLGSDKGLCLLGMTSIKKVNRMKLCKQEGGSWVILIISNILKRMTNF